MLVKLLPEQVGAHWGVIRESIRSALPPTASKDNMHRVLESIMADRMQCWAEIEQRPEGGPVKILGIVTTCFSYDYPSDTKALVLYSVFAWEDTSKETWIKGFATLKKYAEGKGCTRMLAYTNEEKVISLAKMVNGIVDMRMLIFDF